MALLFISYNTVEWHSFHVTSPGEISCRLLADAGVCPRDDDRLAVQTGLAVAPSSRKESSQNPKEDNTHWGGVLKNGRLIMYMYL